ncbi:MAG: 4-hydroxybenzoate polyprenyltransferase [Gammaproteobacteria bacterium]|jgi:4-hydroxybenzoate polyprenyltransferase
MRQVTRFISIAKQSITRISKQMPWYLQLIRFEKPIGVYLLLWPTLWAITIATEARPDPWLLFVFIAGVFLTRSAGCAINDYADRDIDLHVARTEDRPLTSGKITPNEALIVFAILMLLAFLLVLTLNWFTIVLSLGAVVLAATYPFMKRFHYLPQVHLGASFSWGIPMAFAAVHEAVPKEAWLLYVSALIWTVAYDTLYAIADREDDLKVGVKSTAILFGEYDRILVGLFQALFITAMWLIGNSLEFHAIYYFTLIVAVGLMSYEQFMIRHRDPQRCFEAFLHNHWIGGAIFFGVLGHYYLST